MRPSGPVMRAAMNMLDFPHIVGSSHLKENTP